MVYDSDDPDASTTVLHLTAEETRTLGEMLGGSKVTEVTSRGGPRRRRLVDRLGHCCHRPSPFVGRSIGEGMFRTQTGVSIVAVVRDAETFPGTGPEFVFAAGDVAVAVGVPGAIDRVRSMLDGLTPVLAAVGPEIARAFVEIGLLTLVLAGLARLAARLGMTAVPLYLLAGLGLGNGGVADIGIAEDFVAIGGRDRGAPPAPHARPRVHR